MDAEKGMSPQHIIAAIAVAAIVALGYYVLSGNQTDKVETSGEFQLTPTESAEVISGINETAETATLKDAIPTVAPSVNPIEDIYKNPFE